MFWDDVEARIVVISDMQIPYHDYTAVKNIASFIAGFQPDMLVNVGDDTDSPEVSQWSKGNAGEYAKTLQIGFDETKKVHSTFRTALGDKPYHVSRSNHGDRTQKYINRYAPALASLRCLRLPELLGYEELGITYHERPFEIAPGWVCAHGDEGGLSKIPGRTAGLLSEKWATSVVCGHTHRAGIAYKSYGFNSRITYDVAGMEVGHLMDLSGASYLPGGSADWQQAFGLLYVSQGRTWPVLVPVYDGGRFTVEGVTYGL
jgi:predicted phosphodiesterase